MESQLAKHSASGAFHLKCDNPKAASGVDLSQPAIQTSHASNRRQRSVWERYTKPSRLLHTSNQCIVESPASFVLGSNHQRKQRSKWTGPVSARAPFTKDERDPGTAPRRSKRGRQGRTLLLQSVLSSKQVITRTSGRRLGVVSQLWVDASKWEVVAFSVKPSLLFGEEDTILLSSLRQVGDVLLVHDESAVEENVNLVQLGYYNIVGSEVVTENGVYLGKVRDFKFDPEDGALASLVFDGLGISIVPSTVVSTYAMGIGEVLSAGSDRIIVRDGASSRVKRLSMGILEKLSLAEPPWKQDDILYSTYGSALERRPSRYESRSEGRREASPEAASQAPRRTSPSAPAYDESRLASSARTPAYESRRSSAYAEPRTPAYEPRRSSAYVDPRTPAYERAESSAYDRTSASGESTGRGVQSSYEESSQDRGGRYSTATPNSARQSARPMSERRNSTLERGNLILGRQNLNSERNNPILVRGNPVLERENPVSERRSIEPSPGQSFAEKGLPLQREQSPGQRPAETESSPGRFRGAAFGPGEASPRISEATGETEDAADWDTAVERYPARKGEFVEAREPVYIERGSFRERAGAGNREPVERFPVRTGPSAREPVAAKNGAVRADFWKSEEGSPIGKSETRVYGARAAEAGRGVRGGAIRPPRVANDLESRFERNRGPGLEVGERSKTSGRGVDLASSEAGVRGARRPVATPDGQAFENGNGYEKGNGNGNAVTRSSRDAVRRSEDVGSALESGQRRFGQAARDAGSGRARPGIVPGSGSLSDFADGETKLEGDSVGGAPSSRFVRDLSENVGQAPRRISGNGELLTPRVREASISTLKEPVSRSAEPQRFPGRGEPLGAPDPLRMGEPQRFLSREEVPGALDRLRDADKRQKRTGGEDAQLEERPFQSRSRSSRAGWNEQRGIRASRLGVEAPVGQPADVRVTSSEMGQ